jgi:hypothetical protein
MTITYCTAAEKREVIEGLLDSNVPLTFGQKAILRAVCADYRAETPKEIGRVLLAMTDQVQRAAHAKARLGFYPEGTITIVEALCGRWWPVVERALKKFEQRGD